MRCSTITKDIIERGKNTKTDVAKIVITQRSYVMCYRQLRHVTGGLIISLMVNDS